MTERPEARYRAMTITPLTPQSTVDEPTVPFPRAFIDALDTAPPAERADTTSTPPTTAPTDWDETPVSVWATAQTSPAAQRKGRYVPESTAHPAKMLPAVAAHAIAHYTRPGDVVLDPMCGIGSTLVEAIDLDRRAVGVEYEPHWADIARANLRFARQRGHDHDARVVRGDARQLTTLLPPEYVGQVALVVTSPPYGPSAHGLVSTGEQTDDGKVRKHHYRYGSALDRGNLANIGHHRLLAGFTRILTASSPRARVSCARGATW
ncbi:TRM11 family SAM-dependent methyltransferase [Amycolatopsis sp. NPDC001319]|uniref:TRM11 family SAM-dependent methyltransferase n=1 Tax=unclassified Amycolatopsis TaxID=2618356 RepID=UPI00368F16B5